MPGQRVGIFYCLHELGSGDSATIQPLTASGAKERLHLHFSNALNSSHRSVCVVGRVPDLLSDPGRVGETGARSAASLRGTGGATVPHTTPAAASTKAQPSGFAGHFRGSSASPRFAVQVGLEQPVTMPRLGNLVVLAGQVPILGHRCPPHARKKWKLASIDARLLLLLLQASIRYFWLGVARLGVVDH